MGYYDCKFLFFLNYASCKGQEKVAKCTWRWCANMNFTLLFTVTQQQISIYTGCPGSYVSYFVSWPVTKLGKWDFRRNISGVFSIYIWSCKNFWKLVLLHQHLTMKSVNDIQYKQRAVIQFLVAKKQSRKNIHKHLCDVYETVAVNWSATGRWAKWVMASKTWKAELQDLTHPGCPVTSVSPEEPQHDYAIIHGDRHIASWQPVLSLSIAKGSVSHIIWHLWY